MNSISPLVRIALRYAVGFFIAKGLLADNEFSMYLTSPEVVAGVSGLIIEGWYWLANKRGWSK